MRSIVRSSIDLLTADDSMSSLPVYSGFFHYTMGVIRFQIHLVLKRESSRQVLPPSLLFNGQHFLHISAYISQLFIYIFTYVSIFSAIGTCFISVSTNQIHVHYDHNKYGQVRSALPV